MRYFEETFSAKNDKVKLTGYLHEVSSELKNALTRPAILIFPGGGYFSCSDREAEPVALAYMAEGYQAFVLRYSVGKQSTFSEAYDDAINAFTYIRNNAEELQVDVEKIAVTGFSAGGHLAAAVGTMGETKPAAMILGYPCILASMGQMLQKELPGVEGKVTKDTPPTFIFSTSDDMVVPIANSLEFARALDQNGVPFELHIYRSGQHGLSLGKPLTSDGNSAMVNPVVAEWFSASILWLKGIWGDFRVGKLEVHTYEVDINAPIKYLLEHKAARNIILDILPDVEKMIREYPAAGECSPSDLANYMGDIVTDENLAILQKKFEDL